MPRIILPKPATVLDVNVSFSLSGPVEDMQLRPLIDVQIVDEEPPPIEPPPIDPPDKEAGFGVSIVIDNRNLLDYA